MEKLRQDLIFSIRSLSKRWPFALLIVFFLALGIGANSAMFSVINSVLLRPLPYQDPEEVMILFDLYADSNGEMMEYNPSPFNFFEWRLQTASFDAIEAMESRFFTLTGGDLPERVQGAGVSAGFFHVLGVEPVQGRPFLPEEDAPGGERVAILTHESWTSRFGVDESLLGGTIQLDGVPYTVVGILPPGFRFLEDPEMFVPLGFDPVDPPRAQAHFLYTVARLADGVTVEGAQAEMSALATQLAQEYPDTHGGWGAKVEGLHENQVGDLRRPLLLLLAAVGLVLLIVCANVGGLLLSRATQRQDEMAVRMAFGARRRDLLRQMVLEGGLLALVGGVGGLILTAYTVRVLPHLLSADLAEQVRGLTIDGRVLLFTLGVTLVAAILPALVAAGRISARDLMSRLREGGERAGTGVAQRRMQDGLVVVEIALTVVLVISAGLMIRSLARLGDTDLGFDPRRTLTVELSVPEGQFSGLGQEAAFWRRIQEGIEAVPGVESAGVTSVLPVQAFAITTAFHVENRATEQLGEALMANFRRIGPDYLDSLGVPILEGRDFNEGDDHQSTPVAIVSRSMAERYWGVNRAVGNRFIRAREVADERWLTVVGVADDIQDAPVGAEIGDTFYVPLSQGARPTMYVVARASVDPRTLVPAVRRAVLDVDPKQAVGEVETLEERVARSVSDRRFNALMLILFSGLSLALALIGIYGLLTYSVNRRQREMGVRMAFGATAGDLVSSVLRQGARLTLIGVVLGGASAIYLTRFLSSMLFGIEPTDPLTYATTFVALLVVGTAAGLVPAIRAARCNPLQILKSE